jgi:hypothetical protein
MANSNNVNDPLFIKDFIDGAVVANAYSPQILGADEFSRPWRTRIEGERFNPCHDTGAYSARQAFKFFASRACKDNSVLITWFAA